MVESFKDKLVNVLINGKYVKQKDLDKAMVKLWAMGYGAGTILV